MKKFFLILIILIFISCVSKRDTLNGYKYISTNNSNKTLNEIVQETIKDTIISAHNYRSSLSITDSIVKYSNSPILYSNFIAFKFYANYAKKYVINVYSFCNGGFPTTIFIPKLSVFNQVGDEINTTEFQTWASSTLISQWVLDRTIDGYISIVVYSDNNNLFSSLRTIIVYPLIPLNIKSDFCGEFKIRIDEISD